MATFYTTDFIFDRIPSQTYGLKIINFDEGGLFSGVGAPDIDIYTQTILRRDKLFYLGRSQAKALSFQLTFGTQYPISGIDRSIISQWLFGRTGYKKLQIVQDDLNGAWFNCFLTLPTPIYIANLNYAFTATVTCDSQFAYSPLKTTTKTYTGNNVVTDDIVIYNRSASNDYLYPNVSFELNSVGNSFSITNSDDDDREFLFTGLQPEEEISITGDTQVITSSTGLKRLSAFNKNWFRLVPKANHLHIESGIGTFTIDYNERIAIGG